MFAAARQDASVLIQFRADPVVVQILRTGTELQGSVLVAAHRVPDDGQRGNAALLTCDAPAFEAVSLTLHGSAPYVHVRREF
jgi:hypothetical protein